MWGEFCDIYSPLSEIKRKSNAGVEKSDNLNNVSASTILVEPEEAKTFVQDVAKKLNLSEKKVKERGVINVIKNKM